MDLENFYKPFRGDDLEWRVQRSGKTGKGNLWAIIVPYLTSRAVMDRLDETVGPGGWSDSYQIYDKNLICTIIIKIGDEWVSKQDGAQETNIEAFKGGIADAFKRAAVKWGMGRDLYKCPTVYAEFVDRNTPGAEYLKIENETHYWIPPKDADDKIPVSSLYKKKTNGEPERQRDKLSLA